jgi:hypothetical protein
MFSRWYQTDEQKGSETMKRLVTFALFATALSWIAPGILQAQNAGLDLTLVSASPDSVVLKATMYTGTGVSFRLESATVGVKYDPARFGTRYNRSVMNHRLAGQGFEADTVELYDIDLVYPDILHYGEMPPWSNPNLNMNIPQNVSLDLCTFTFFPLSPNPDTTSFLLTTGFLTGYYISTAIPKQDFTPLNSLYTIFYPVELLSFSAAQQGTVVALKWSTAMETNNHGFIIERRRVDGVPDEWTQIGFTNGQGTTVNVSAYLFLDKKLPGGGTYEYRLRQEDFDGKTTVMRSARVEYRNGPTVFGLDQAYPNPTSASGAPTQLRYAIAERGTVRLVISNALGQQVADLVHGNLDAGQYTAEWAPHGLAPGVYLATLTAQTGDAAPRSATIRIHVSR